MGELRHPSANRFATDPDPKATERAVLSELVKLPPFHSLTTRVIQYRLFGTEAVGADRTHSAIGRLHNAGMVERAGAYKSDRRRWRITEKGRLWIGNAHVFQPDGAA